MIRKYLTSLLALLVILSYGSQSPLLGKLTFTGSKQIAVIRPLSQQPKIANIKNSLLQLAIVNEIQTCGILNKTLFQRQYDEPPVLAVIDLSSNRISCGMMMKIQRIKQAGGNGFIIVTDNQQFSINHCSMYDDNNFFTGVIDTNNFNILQKQKSKPLYASLNIELKDSSHTLLEIWTSSLSPTSYQNLLIISQVFQRLPTLQSKLEWKPRIASLGCTHNQNQNICNQQDFVASCGCKGQFCSPEAHERTVSVLVQEDLRQYLIFKQYPSKYFQYVKKFYTTCLANYQSNRYSQDCATSLMQRLGIDSYTINTNVDKFLTRCSLDEQRQQIIKTEIFQILNKDKLAFVNYGRYPLILINKKIMDYKNQDDLVGQLCRKLSLEDDGCYQISSQTKTTVVSGMFYVLLVILLIGVGAAVVYFYRKKLKRDMNKEIKMQVSTAVEHYFALTDVK